MKGARLARDAGLERAFRLNLSAWDLRLHPLRVRCEHPGMVHAASYSPDGRPIAVAGDDNSVQVRDAATGEPIGEPFRHPSKVGGLAFSPDGRTVISGGQENTAYLRDVPSALDAPIARLERSLRISTGMALLDDGSIHILDSPEWNERRAQPDDANSTP